MNLNKLVNTIPQRLRTSFWFVPAVMASAATALALLTLRFERSEVWSGVGPDSPEAARAILTTIVSILATVTGVAFSMTFVALSFSSNAMGPRLLRNFMRRRSQQIPVGCFIAAMLYSMFVLSSIRGPGSDAFVPSGSITIALALAAVSLAMLVFFLHRVSVGIQVDNVIDELTAQALEKIESCFIDEKGTASELPERVEQVKEDLVADTAGYVQEVDWEELVSLATTHELRVRVAPIAGDLILKGQEVMILEGVDLSDAPRDDLIACIQVGAMRTEQQDPRFALHEIVEIALRALSTGVCDPFTAMSCIDKLTIILAACVGREPKGTVLFDDKGHGRVQRRTLTFTHLMNSSFSQIRQNADVAVSLRLLASLEQLADRLVREEEFEAVLDHAEQVLEAATNLNGTRSDEGDLSAIFERLRNRVAAKREARDRLQ